MDEYKSFNLTKIDASPQKEENKSSFQSVLGNFSHLQDRIITFGRGKKMFLLTALIIIGYILSFVTMSVFLITDLTFTVGDELKSINWVKIILVILLGIETIVPLAVLFITYGCHKLKVNAILRGTQMIDFLLSLIYVMIVLAAIICLFAFLKLLFASFIIVVISGAIVFGIFYIYLKFLSKAKEFCLDISNAFSSASRSSIKYPSADSLRLYFVALLILSIINWFLNLGDSNALLDQLNLEAFNVLEKVNLISNISFVLTLITYSFVVYLTGEFDSCLEAGKPAEFYRPKGETQYKMSPPILTNIIEEDNWRLK